MDERIFPLKAVKLLFDATKTMIPVITGFLVVFSGTLGGEPPSFSPPPLFT